MPRGGKRGRRTDGINFAGLNSLESGCIVVGVVRRSGQGGPDGPVLYKGKTRITQYRGTKKVGDWKGNGYLQLTTRS